MNIKEWLQQSVTKLSNVDNPKYELKIFLSYVLQCTQSYILSSDHLPLNKTQLKDLNFLINRRSLGEPIAYILGKKEFWSLSLYVSHDTLIPRPDTEILVEQALLKIKSNFSKILDLGTGCGAIALSLGSVCKTWKIIGIDKSKKAIKIAQLNALQLNIQNVSFFYSNWFSHIYEKFDIIISNPPYVSKEEIKSLKKDIFFEPINAIISNNNGLSDIECIIQKSKDYLFIGGWLFIEHGWNQKFKVQSFFKKYNFCEIRSYQDYGGNDRVTIGQKQYYI